MQNRLMDLVEKTTTLKPSTPKFEIGDTVDVHVRILEGDKERIQIYNGVVIARSARGLARCSWSGRIVQGEGVERKFSPSIPADHRHRGELLGQGPACQALLSAWSKLGQGGAAQGAFQQHDEAA